MAVVYTIMGLMIHIQRVAMAVSYVVGLLMVLVPVETKRAVGMPLDRAEFWTGEMASFAATSWFALTFSTLWATKIAIEGTRNASSKKAE